MRELQEIHLFKAAVEVVTRIIPGITWVVYIGISPRVREYDFSVCIDFGECVEDVAGVVVMVPMSTIGETRRSIGDAREILRWYERGGEFAAIDPPEH